MAVQVVSVRRGPVRDFVTGVAAGRVAGKQEATLRSEVAATVRAVHHRRGERVRAGEPLVSYDPNELRDRLRAAEAGASVAHAQSLQAEQNAALAESSAMRARRLRDGGSISQAEVENLEGQAKALARAAEASRAAVTQAQANIAVARTALGKSTVRAPFDGVILSTSIEPGEMGVPGSPLVVLADVSSLHVDADVDEADVGRITVGMPADVTLDAFPGERLRASVREIAPSVTRDGHGGRSVAVEVELPSDTRLRVGMSADVDVIVAVHEGVLWLPPSAVQGRGTERSAFIVKNGIGRKRPIEVGVATWEAVEVRAGLAEGDEVVATLSVPIVDGARVEPRRAATGGTP